MPLFKEKVMNDELETFALDYSSLPICWLYD